MKKVTTLKLSIACDIHDQKKWYLDIILISKQFTDLPI